MGKAGRPKGSTDKVTMRLTEKQMSELSKSLNASMISAFNFVKDVFNSKETITIEGFTKKGMETIKTIDKYSPELKARLFEKLVDKTFPDQKMILNDLEGESDGVNVVAFGFTKIKKEKT